MIDLINEYDDSELKSRTIKTFVAEGAVREPWGFSRGAKTERFYKTEGKILIRVYYSYNYKNGFRDVADLDQYIQYYDSNETVFLTIDLNKQLSIKGLAALNREIRQGRIDYMVEAGKELAQVALIVPEPYATAFTNAAAAVPLILEYYHNEIADYIAIPENSDFEDAVNGESNQDILDLFTLMVRPPDADFTEGLTMKESILHQLTGVY